MSKAPDIKSAMAAVERVKSTCWLMDSLLKNLNGEHQHGAVLKGVELQGIASLFHMIVMDMETIEADLEPA
jgi:hypothetical protein